MRPRINRPRILSVASASRFTKPMSTIRRGSAEWERLHWPKYVLSLDLGQTNDYSAYTITQRIVPVVDPEDSSQPGFSEPPLEYHVRHAHRFPLRTTYDAVVQEISGLATKDDLAGQIAIVIDASGVGIPVSNYFHKRGIRHTPLIITSGTAENSQGRVQYVPKRNLIACLQIMLERKTLRIGRNIESAEILTNELTMFRAKKSKTGHDTYEAWRERDHDDLVISVAMTTWYCIRAEQQRLPRIIVRSY